MIKDDISYWTHAIAGIVIAGVIWMLVPTGCKTTNSGIGRDVQSSAEQIGELRQQNRELTARVERQQELYQQFRDAIGRAEADAAGAISDGREAIKLFTEYKRRIDEYFAAVNSLERKAITGTQDSPGTYGYLTVPDSLNDSGLYSVRKGD